MARTRPLTQAQREEAERKRICQDIMDRLNERRGRDRKSNTEFAADIGVSKDTWYRWNRGELPTCEFGKLLVALYRAGLALELVKPA